MSGELPIEESADLPLPGVYAFSDAGTKAPRVLLLDANAIIDLGEHELASKVVKSGSSAKSRYKKHSALVTCLSRLCAKKMKVFVTLAVLEEVFHVYSSRMLQPVIDQYQCKKEKDLRNQFPDAHKGARKQGIALLVNAVIAAKKHRAQVILSSDLDTETKLGELVYKAFVAMLSDCEYLGGKDALHVVMAAQFGCNAFATRDEDFLHLPDAILYCPAYMVPSAHST